jgi:tetratricopeptide (TPR) repeat protein
LPELADGVTVEDHPDTVAADQWYEAERAALEAVVHLALARGNVLAAAAIVVDWRPMAYSSAYETAALPFLVAVLAAMDPEDDSVVKAEVLRYAGDTGFWGNQYEASRTYLDRALTIFRDRGDLSGQSRTLRNLSRLTGLQKRWAEEVEFLDLSVAAARAAGDAGTLVAALSDSIVRLCRLGRVDEAAIASTEATMVAEQAGLRYYVADVLGNEAYGLVGAGHYDAALDRVERYAVARVQLGRTKVLEEMFELLIRGHAYRGVGRNDEARRAFEKYLDLRGTVASFDYTSDWEGFAEPDAIRDILAELRTASVENGER